MIQIDMSMPDNCLECRFNTSEFGYCNAMPVEFVGQVSDFEEDGKPEWCPLKAQEPVMVQKKPMEMVGLQTWDWACGNCGQTVLFSAKFCPWCGRAVKWDG